MHNVWCTADGVYNFMLHALLKKHSVQVSTSHTKDKAQSPAVLPANPTELTQPEAEAQDHAAVAAAADDDDEMSAVQGGISSSPNLPDVV